MCDILETAGPEAVTLEDAGDDPQLEPAPGATPLWPRIRVRALYAHSGARDAVRTMLRAAPQVTDLRTREIADRDWLAASRENIEPLAIGPLWIGPHGMTPPPGRSAVHLEPGLAFGSGRHPTTRLCLEWLVASRVTGLDVIDYGCGSGILAIAAAILGARRVTALDIDPQARQATIENARINGVSDRVRVIADCAEATPAALVIANILAGPLVELARVITGLTMPGGRLALSGLLESQVDEVAAAYDDPLDVHVGASSEGWIRLDGVRRESARHDG